MDCTPDISHNEQLSVVLHIVNCELHKGVSIHKHFAGFLMAEDTTGKGLLELFLGHLETLHLDISDCCGQSYDNGSNVQGKKQGVQKRVLDLNPKALCVPCGSHTLNLVIGDAAKSSTISLNFYGVLERLYKLFSHSVQRWAHSSGECEGFYHQNLVNHQMGMSHGGCKSCTVSASKHFECPGGSTRASSATSLCQELKKMAIHGKLCGVVQCTVHYQQS